MRTVLLPAAMLAALTACAQGAPDPATDQATLEAEAPVWFDHYNRGDAEAVTNLYTEDDVVMPAGAPTATGHAAIRSYIVADIAESRAGGLTMRNGSVTGVGVSGDMGWVSGDYSVVDAAGAIVDHGKYLSVSRRTGDGWKMIRDIWNSDAAPAAAAPATDSQ